MSLALDVLTWLLLAGGGFFCVTGGLGLIRLPDFYARTHAGGLTDTLGAALILLGLMLQAPSPMVVGKLLFVIVFLFFTSPTSAHALARAAFFHGLKPILHGQSFDPALRAGHLDPDAPADDLDQAPPEGREDPDAPWT
jgi:multicomponent Na+:H+ antiporter subunit G